MATEQLFGDLYNIGERVKEIDPLLSISFDRSINKYRVTRSRRQIATINPGELDERLLTRLRENDLHRQRLEDYIYKLEQSELAHERAQARELSNRLESITIENFDRIAGITHHHVGGLKL